MPEPMEIDQVQDLFERFPLNDSGDLWVAIYSRRLWAQHLYQRVLQGDGDSETENQYHRQLLLLSTGHDEFFNEEDYYLDVLDGFNQIARYGNRDYVVGRRIMSWIEFRASTDRDVSRFTSFAEFRLRVRELPDELDALNVPAVVQSGHEVVRLLLVDVQRVDRANEAIRYASA